MMYRALSIFLLTCGLFDLLTFAQSRQIPAAPQKQPIIIFSATVHPVSSDPIQNGYIVFDKGVITGIGEGEPPSTPNAIKLNAEGLHVYPGLVAASTYLGLTEIGDISQTNDHSEMGRVKPEVRAVSAINPDSDLIPVARANGILTAMILPRGGLIAGRCSTVRLDGWTWENMSIDPDAGLVVNWPRTEPITAWWMERTEEQQRKEIKEDLEAIEKIFDEAIAYIKARDNDRSLPTDLRFEAMRPALQGAKPIFISAAMVGQIESAVAWARRRNLKIVIVGGDQADQVAPLLKKHDIPVIVTGTHRLPTRRHDAYDQPFTLPAKLHEAGVQFCIAAGGEAAHERNLNHMAATAAAYGLPKSEALKAVTINAARIIGAGEHFGSLEVGKSATLIVTAGPESNSNSESTAAPPPPGDPLEITTDTLVAFIDGCRIDLGNRQKGLYDKYQEKYRQLGLMRN